MRNYRSSSALRKLQNLCERANSVNEGVFSVTDYNFSPEDLPIIIKYLSEAKKAYEAFKKKNRGLSFSDGEAGVNIKANGREVTITVDYIDDDGDVIVYEGEFDTKWDMA